MNILEIQAGDMVSLRIKDSWFNKEIGIVVKTLSTKEINELVAQNRWDDSCGPIVVNLPYTKEIHFNSWIRNSVPKEEKKWFFLKEEEIILRKEGSEAGPLSIEEIIELELSQMTNPPYVRIGHYPSRHDKKCWILDCNENEHDGIWFNVWGSGTRIPVCKKHFNENGKMTWCDDIFIKTKKTNE